MNNVINARLRLVQQLGHLSGALSITVAGNEGANGLYNKLNAGFSGCVDTIKIGVENEVRIVIVVTSQETCLIIHYSPGC